MKRYDELEKIYVHDIYEKISKEFDITRTYHWSAVKNFLNELPSNSYGIDIGCGNGRNMLYREDLVMDGIDKCNNLVEICKNKGLNVKIGDAMNILEKNNTYDFALSIAVIHHLSNSKRRAKAFLEMIRIIKKGGVGLMSVWSLEQPKSSKREFNLGDNIVKWHSYNRETKNQDKLERYYHICDEKLFQEFIECAGDTITVLDKFNEMGNWYLKFIKN